VVDILAALTIATFGLIRVNKHVKLPLSQRAFSVFSDAGGNRIKMADLPVIRVTDTLTSVSF
jgi:hypothetical protein